MAGLAEQIRETEAKLARLKSLAAAVTCAEMGEHDWRFIGSCGCTCSDGYCSVPVHECARCGDCDYGNNAEAAEVKLECAKVIGLHESQRSLPSQKEVV